MPATCSTALPNNRGVFGLYRPDRLAGAISFAPDIAGPQTALPFIQAQVAPEVPTERQGVEVGGFAAAVGDDQARGQPLPQSRVTPSTFLNLTGKRLRD
jgi:hypothetical protein